MSFRLAFLAKRRSSWRAFPAEKPPPEVDTIYFESVKSLLEALEGEAFEAVVIDWRTLARLFPEAEDVLRSIADRVAVPVFALCACRAETLRALEAGFEEILPRNFSWPHLAARIEVRQSLSATRLELKNAKDELKRAKLELGDLLGRVDSSGRVRDDLTGLPNRKALELALRGALAAGSQGGRQIVLAIFDIDNFRLVNTTFGRHEGNEVLQGVAQQFVACVRDDDFSRSAGAGSSAVMAARLGGDQFALLATGVSADASVAKIVSGVHRALSRNYQLSHERDVLISVSAGVVIAPRDGRSPDELLSKAEAACAEAASLGSGVTRFHDSRAAHETPTATRIAASLSSALLRDQFELHFQPIIDAQTSHINAAEALLRWNHPELGPVSPAVFVPLAEERGLMPAIGSWVLRRSLLELKDWVDSELTALRMAINVSISQLARDDFVRDLRESLEESGVPEELVELEISERGALRDDPDILARLHEIRDLGCRLAIDDFGTGNSSVRYLKRFPLTSLKIDRSFVRDLAASDDDAVIVTAIAAMARQLRLRTVAEGVETRYQQDFLQRCGCDELQGFLFSKPLPSKEFRRFLLGASGRVPSLVS